MSTIAPVYQARVLLTKDGETVKSLCCLDNVGLSFDNTEGVEQTTHDGCLIKKINTLSAEVNFDIYTIDDVESLSLMFPQGTVTQVAGTAVTGATQTLTEGSFVVGGAYTFENRNANGTAPTVTSVVGSVDGALVLDTDYEIVTTTTCLPNKETYSTYQIRILSGVSLDQDIVITYNYTPRAGYCFSLTTGAYTQNPLSVKIIAVNKNDNTDIMEVDIESATFEFSGAVLQFGDPEAEFDAVSMTLKVTKNTGISICGLKDSRACPCT